MAFVAYWIEAARALRRVLRRSKRQMGPGMRALLTLLSSAFDLARGLVQANWDHPTTGRTGDRLDERKTEQRSGYATNEVAARAFTTGLQSLGHSNLRNRDVVASFRTEVKRGPVRQTPWRLAAQPIVELRPEDEIRRGRSWGF